MAVQIQINQGSLPPGIPGRAREDLVLNQPVVLTAIGIGITEWLWRVIHRPIDIITPLRATANITSPDASSTQITGINVEGTYHIELVVDSGSGLGALPEDVVRITFYAGPPLAQDSDCLPRRSPAFAETTEHNVPDNIEPTGNSEGWSREWLKWFEVIKRAAKGTSFAWGRVTMTATTTTLGDSYNITSINKTGTGTVQVTYTRPIPTGLKYTINASAAGTTGGSCTIINNNNAGFTLERGDFGGGIVNANFNFVVYAGL
jgi:hypothetical protein